MPEDRPARSFSEQHRALIRQMYQQHEELLVAIREVALKINPERARANEQLWKPAPKCPEQYSE